MSHGLRYALPPKKIEYSRWFLPFEKLLLKLKDIPIYDSTQDGFNFVRSSLKNTALKYFYSFKPHLTELHKNYYKLINDLRKDKTILILKPDKGNAVVLLNKIDYQQKMMTIINDTSKFKILNEDLLTLLTVKDSFSFVEEITNILNSNSYTMVSFDVQSLFTNIPLVETINIAADKFLVKRVTDSSL